MPVQRAGRREMYNCGFCCAPARASMGRYTELHCRRCTAHRTPTSRFSTGPKSTAGRTAASASSLHTSMIVAARILRLSAVGAYKWQGCAHNRTAGERRWTCIYVRLMMV